MVAGDLISAPVPRFCRHNRLLAECPICSRGTVLDPALRRGRASRPASRGRAAAAREPPRTPVRGPYAAAGPYPGGAEVRLERVPGGLRLAEWRAGAIERSAPELPEADLPGLLAGAAAHGLLEPPEALPGAAADGEHGSSPGRAGELRDDLRVERVGGERLRIARWMLRPGSGWQLQEAPVMLPAARFEEALRSAAERGVIGGREGSTVAAPGEEHDDEREVDG
jgi:hypothetical protein